MKKQFFAAICSLTMLAGAAGFVPALNLSVADEISAEAVTWLGSEVKDNIRWYYYYSNDINSMANYKIVKAEPVNSTVTEAKFPSTVNGKAINRIGDNVFKGNTQIKTATIPSQIKNIDDNFFMNSTKLESITLSSDLRCLGNNAFRHATKLQNIVVPNSCYWIGDYFCYDDDSLINVNIGNNVEDIGSNCCENCNYLRNVNIGSGLRRMGNYAFYGCNRMDTFNCNSTQIEEFGYGSLWNNKYADTWAANHNNAPLIIGNMLYRYYKQAPTQMFAANFEGHNITYIYDYAFSAAAYQYGSSVRFFYMPDVEHIGIGAFINCPNAWLLISRSKMQASYGDNYEEIIGARVHPNACIQWLS